MFWENHKYLILSIVISISPLLFFNESYAAPTVEIMVNPNEFDVSVGSNPIPLTVQVIGTNLEFEWTLLGPGNFEGDTTNSVVFYKPPNKIDGKSAKAIVTAKVRDDDGREVIESFTVNILSNGDDTSTPSPTSSQISDFPTFSKILSFSGYQWRVKSSASPFGPGPNYFSDNSENVWVDELGQLHLKITKRNGKWYCAEVVSKETFGYGTYRFYVASRIDQLDENVIVGLFTWDDDPANNHREIDIEFAKWGQAENENAQFVVQPWNTFGNMVRFPIQLNETLSTHSFDWRNDNILFQSIYGHYSTPPDSHIVVMWNYTGQDIPPPGNENARINLWLFNGEPPSDRQEVEIVITKFEFIPFTE